MLHLKVLSAIILGLSVTQPAFALFGIGKKVYAYEGPAIDCSGDPVEEYRYSFGKTCLVQSNTQCIKFDDRSDKYCFLKMDDISNVSPIMSWESGWGNAHQHCEGCIIDAKPLDEMPLQYVADVGAKYYIVEKVKGKCPTDRCVADKIAKQGKI